MPGIQQNELFDIWKWFSFLPLSLLQITLTWLVLLSGGKKKMPIKSHHTTSICLSAAVFPTPSHKIPGHKPIHPQALTNMIRTLSNLTLPSPSLSVAHTGSRCWLTAWMCLIINRAAGATMLGLWWQKLQRQSPPLPSGLPKCHLNEIGPVAQGLATA